MGGWILQWTSTPASASRSNNAPRCRRQRRRRRPVDHHRRPPSPALSAGCPAVVPAPVSASVPASVAVSSPPSRSSRRSSATAASPTLPADTSVSAMISLTGSMPRWPCSRRSPSEGLVVQAFVAHAAVLEIHERRVQRSAVHDQTLARLGRSGPRRFPQLVPVGRQFVASLDAFVILAPVTVQVCRAGGYVGSDPGVVDLRPRVAGSPWYLAGRGRGGPQADRGPPNIETARREQRPWSLHMAAACAAGRRCGGQRSEPSSPPCGTKSIPCGFRAVLTLAIWPLPRFSRPR